MFNIANCSISAIASPFAADLIGADNQRVQINISARNYKTKIAGVSQIEKFFSKIILLT
jgi:hypothetical protein